MKRLRTSRGSFDVSVPQGAVGGISSVVEDEEAAKKRDQGQVRVRAGGLKGCR